MAWPSRDLRYYSECPSDECIFYRGDYDDHLIIFVIILEHADSVYSKFGSFPGCDSGGNELGF